MIDRYYGTKMALLPKRAQFYIVCIWILSLTTIYNVSRLKLPILDRPVWELILFVALATFAGSKKIKIIPVKDEASGSLSLCSAVVFASLLHFGPVGAVITHGISCLFSCFFPKRQHFYQWSFNLAITIIAIGLGSILYLILNEGNLIGSPVRMFSALIPATALYFAINTGGVSCIIGICSDQEPLKVWKESYFWTFPSFLTGASFSALAIILFRNQISVIMLFTMPAVYMSYQFYLTHVKRNEDKAQFVEELQVGKEHLADLYLSTIKSLALAIDAKDQYTHQHILRVQKYSVAVAKHMGVSGNDMEGITTGALLHDIGKLGVPDYVLLKPGKLTEEEFNKIKQHPEIGAAILDPVDFPWPVIDVVKYHHEKWDGTGYPEGLKGENIPRLARILAVADVYDALTSSRSYRGAWTHERAVNLISDNSGSHFDPQIVVAFLEVIHGVVEEMAKNGEGPLVKKEVTSKSSSKTEMAARVIHQSSTELWALYEVAQSLSSSLGLEETLDILGRKLEAIFPGTTCLFLILDETNEKMHVKTTNGLNREFFQGAKTMTPQSLSMTAIRNSRTYLGEYDPEDIMVTSSQFTEWKVLQSALIVPIIHQGNKLGTINLYHPEAKSFSEHDAQLLELIAERAALALYNGSLFNRTQSNELKDELTGLHNLRFLMEKMSERTASSEERRTQRKETLEFATERSSDCVRKEDAFALICLDLDCFKPINDKYGHHKGDEALKGLSELFLEIAREDDLVARSGGDEFLILLDQAGPEEAEQTLLRLKIAVENYNLGLKHPKLGSLRLGVSGGYSCYPKDATESSTLLSIADIKMYKDKAERKLGSLIDRTQNRSSRVVHLYQTEQENEEDLSCNDEIDFQREAA